MAAKASTPPIVEKSAVETYPAFTKEILEQLGKLPAKIFIDLLITIVEQGDCTSDFEKRIVESMRLIKSPSYELVTEFLFDSMRDNNFQNKDTYIIALEALNDMIGEEDKSRLAETIMGYLCDKIENSSHRGLLNLYQDLTADSK